MTIRINHFKTRLVRYPILTLAALAFVVSLGLAFDLSKSDWANWVQAVGSVAALAVAMFIMWWQSRRDAQVATIRGLERQRNLVAAAHHSSTRLKTALCVLEAMLSCGGSPNQNNVQMAIANLNNILGGIDRIPMWEISGKSALDLGSLAALCNTAIAFIEWHRNTNYQTVNSFFAGVQTFHEKAKAKEGAFSEAIEKLDLELQRRS